MILSLREWPVGEALGADVCIVGAGAVGIAMALDLAKAGVDVLLLEAGGLQADAKAQALYEGEVADAAMHSPLDQYRARRFGGTTTLWGGRCMPLDPIDFEARDWIDHSGWPFDLAALLPFYPEANRLCEAGAFAYTMGEAFPDARRPMIAGFEGRDFTTDTIERFSCPTDFGTRYKADLAAAKTVRVMLDANITAIRLNAEGTAVTALDVATLDGGARHRVTAGRFVIAAGGLETTRLLLASNDVQPAGIGNAHDVLGRYYMCHIAGTIGTLALREGGVWHGYDVAADATYCRRRFALRPETQAAHRLGNFVARLHHPRISDARHGSGILSALHMGRVLIPVQYRKRLENPDPEGLAGLVRHIGNIARDAPALAGFVWHMLRDRRFAARKYPSIIVTPRGGRYSLDFHAEQEPNPASRLTLTANRDALGMPRLSVDWRYTAGDVTTVKGALALLANDIARSGCGTFSYDEAEVEQEMTRYGAYGGHHIGTARMGTDPRESVVDADCRVHGIANLYVAGAAVFPTSSQANPTLTAVALGLRLADHLRR